MRPDQPLNQNNNPGSSYPNQQPIRRHVQDFGGQASPRPMQDFRPQTTPQRPVNGFSPHPAPKPVNNNVPQPLRQQRVNNFQPYAPPQRPLNTGLAQQSQPVAPLTFEPPKTKKKKGKKILASAAVAVLLITAGFLFVVGGNDNGKPSVKAQAQNSQPTVKPLETPDFTVYFPNPMPSGLKISKGSVTYYKDSFTFIIEQGGQKSFFVYEQPANTDPDFNSLKSKLAAPKAIALTTGQGVEGGLENGTVTAVKTDKNTIIIISCTKAVCSTTPRDIISNMQLNTELESLRKSNS
jgi:hypothetical protein